MNIKSSIYNEIHVNILVQCFMLVCFSQMTKTTKKYTSVKCLILCFPELSITKFISLNTSNLVSLIFFFMYGNIKIIFNYDNIFT